ncbi:hypothetical protein B0H63DRAFT_560875 [Podospora didyma]|uniref:Uncharacterized protein n=1 Tax=Podospora didyma TaxID=330526 RepID=A0AAE0TVI1_9PEZI|nr:hypothetical protein B0H63DRAFT_560875 [Podospora didyma]
MERRIVAFTPAPGEVDEARTVMAELLAKFIEKKVETLELAYSAEEARNETEKARLETELHKIIAQIEEKEKETFRNVLKYFAIRFFYCDAAKAKLNNDVVPRDPSEIASHIEDEEHQRAPLPLTRINGTGRKKSISFKEEMKSGKCTIYEHPKDCRRFYILQCGEHNVQFFSTEANTLPNAAVKYFGIRVFDCNRQKARLNNARFKLRDDEGDDRMSDVEDYKSVDEEDDWRGSDDDEEEDNDERMEDDDDDDDEMMKGEDREEGMGATNEMIENNDDNDDGRCDEEVEDNRGEEGEGGNGGRRESKMAIVSSPSTLPKYATSVAASMSARLAKTHDLQRPTTGSAFPYQDGTVIGI